VTGARKVFGLIGMFDLLKNLGEMLRNSFVGWLKMRKREKYLGIVALLFIITNTITLFMIGSLAGSYAKIIKSHALFP